MMLPPFKLERYFAEYEFKVQHLLSASDCEALRLEELLALADSESLTLWENLSLEYTESQGHPLLRQEIARLYETCGPEHILTAVPEEAIFIAMHTIIQPGDQVIAISPAYQSLHTLAQARGCQVLPWQMQLEHGAWQLDLDWLADRLSNRTRLLILNFPHNPTGYLPSQAEFRSIIELASRQGVLVFSDEMYRLLEYQPGERLPAACDLYERAISLSGLSKSMALPGLRLGWLAARPAGWLQDWLAYKDYTTICGSAPSEILAIIALRAREHIVDRNLKIIKNNLHAAEEFCSRYTAQFEWLPPRAGSVAFPRWRGPGAGDAFCQKALDQAGVMIVPGSIFDYPGDHFRVGLGRTNLPQALEALTSLLQE